MNEMKRDCLIKTIHAAAAAADEPFEKLYGCPSRPRLFYFLRPL